MENAFENVLAALEANEQALREEMSQINQQIKALEAKIRDLNTKQESLQHDRQSISEMYSRYHNDNPENPIEF